MLFACRKEARRAKLKGTAGAMKDSGKDKQIFNSSDYMVSRIQSFWPLFRGPASVIIFEM